MQVTPLSIEAVPLSGVTLIEASAGTGKTYTLAALFVRLLLESELTVDQILVVTYTRAATAELRVRIRQRIALTIEALDAATVSDDEVLAQLVAQAQLAGQTARKRALLASALSGFDEAAIFTIHGFCQRVLKRFAFESGVSFEAELTDDQALLLEEIVCDFWATKLSTASAPFAAALAKQAIDIESLSRLARRVLPNPDLHVVPEPELSDPHELERAFEAERLRVAQLWAANTPELTRLLLESGLHRSHFGPSHVHEKYTPALDRLHEFTLHELPDWLEKLTPERLRGYCNRGGRAPEHAFFDACADFVAAIKALKATLEQQVYAYLHEFLVYVRAELPRRSEERGSLGFEDLLLSLFKALRSERGPVLVELIRSTYRAALIDEFQDTDPVQLDVFRRIYAARSHEPQAPALFLIGDPKQAIYAFRGADIFAYMAASQHAIDRVHTLAVNYRSDPSLVRAVECLFVRAQRPFVFEEIAYRHVAARPGREDALSGPALEFLLLERAADQQDKLLAKGDMQLEIAARVAAEIAQLLCSGQRLKDQPIEPGHVAVLCRTNAQAQLVQRMLRERGIPAVLDGDASVFDAAMADELSRWLFAMVEPADAARIRAALATEGLGLTADDLLRLESDESAWDAWVGRFHRLQSLWLTRGFLCALHTLCDECQVTQRLLALADGERRYTDLWHLAELLHEAEQRTGKGPRALLDFYRRVRAGLATRDGMALEDVQLRLESDARAVTLTTVHKSKGLEYPIVYCPFLWASAQLAGEDKRMPLFHDRAHEDRSLLVLPAGESNPFTRDAQAAAQREALGEAMRLLYVALTRARHRVSIVWGAIKGVEHSALAYLVHQLHASGGDVDALRQQVAERIGAASDADLSADLAQLTAAAGGAVGVRALRSASGAPGYRASALAQERLRARSADWPSHPLARVGSFSSLIDSQKARHAAPSPATQALEGLDRDAAQPQSASGAASATDTAPRVALADFPAGANFGHLIHAIYEHADFQAGQAELALVTRAVSADYGADAALAEPLAAALFDTLHTPLSAAGGALPSLASVSKGARLNELEFTFPVVDHALGDHSQTALRASQLGALLSRHARDAGERSYAEELARLRFAPLRGFLRGFIDLIAVHDERYYVLDYKSNRLGEHAQAYRREQLVPVMHRHHYTLQYLLYSVALHRYLQLRQRAYDYERHFGGVYYLFIRGMSVQHEPGTGVLFERPEQSLIEALSSWLRAPEVSL